MAFPSCSFGVGVLAPMATPNTSRSRAMGPATRSRYRARDISIPPSVPGVRRAPVSHPRATRRRCDQLTRVRVPGPVPTGPSFHDGGHEVVDAATWALRLHVQVRGGGHQDRDRDRAAEPQEGDLRRCGLVEAEDTAGDGGCAVHDPECDVQIDETGEWRMAEPLEEATGRIHHRPGGRGDRTIGLRAPAFGRGRRAGSSPGTIRLGTGWCEDRPAPGPGRSAERQHGAMGVPPLLATVYPHAVRRA